MPTMNVNDFIAATRGQLQRLSHPLALAAASGDERKFHYQLLLRYKILDPNSEIVLRWNYIFLLTCIAALFIDPLYFFLPSVGDDGACLSSDNSVLASVTVFRTLTDLFYVLNIIIKFRTAFVSKSSRVFGTGELVMDPYEIAWRYLKSDFVIDFAASLPLPQVVNWFVIPTLKRNKAEPTNYTLAFIVFVQYIPRFFLMFPLNKRIIKSTGVIAKNAWSGVAYNLLLYMLSSHILGSIWYTTAISRQYSCWRLECDDEKEKFPPCLPKYLDCSTKDDVDRQYWFNNTDVVQHCKPGDKDAVFQFGIFGEAFISGVGSSIFMKKYLYCLWFGFKNLSSFGTNLETTNFIGETVFCILMCIVGLFLFCLLIGNVQTYLQSLTVRVEEWRIKRTDTEEWMRHRQLPPELQERVRKFIQYYWLSTRGVDEETILRSLPLDLRREIRRHLCLNLVRRVPFFSKMDELLLDAVCERLIATLSTQGTYIFREGDPVDEMLFIIRGQLESSTTGGGRSGFFNCIILRPGDFCGEELLTWALVPNANLSLPSSTRTIKALTEVEAFALMADDLKFFSSQFKRLHSKALQDAFRYHSHQWRTWGACYVQNAWKRYRRKKMAKELALQESMSYMTDEDTVEDNYSSEENKTLASPKESNTADSSRHLGATKLASKFAVSARKGVTQWGQVGEVSSSATDDLKMPKMFKPDMPDFS